MKFTKTHGFILAAAVAVVIIYLLFFRKKSAESSYGFIVPGVPAYPRTRAVPPTVLGKVKYVGEITNKPKPCPAGSHQVTNADGSYGCVANTK